MIFFFLQEAFCGPEYAENAFAAGALPWTPLGELTMLPKPPSWPGRGHPSTDPIPCRRLRRLDPQSASGARIYLPVHIISDYTPLISTYATCAHIRTGAVRNCLKRQTANTNQKLEWIINSR